ncbi:N-acetylmuramoyl-L-alanine amidase, partial [Streptomyces sp. NEAU-H3]|nr:N-acetylmuramoyl-L-alanine amidase [Streptomyces sp. NEAU-H3]
MEGTSGRGHGPRLPDGGGRLGRRALLVGGA